MDWNDGSLGRGSLTGRKEKVVSGSGRNNNLISRKIDRLLVKYL